MDGGDIAVEDGNDGTRKRKSKETRRQARKKLKYLDPNPDLNNFTRPCDHNRKTFVCAKIKMKEIRTARKDFFSEVDKVRQDMKLCNFLSVMPAKRHRANQGLKQKDSTVSYFFKSAKKMFSVCQKFFISVFGVTKHRIITVAKVLEAGEVSREKRADRVSHKSKSKKQKVREFIGKLRGKESHYNRSKSKRMYLSANLSIAKLQKFYNRKCEVQDRVTYDMFRNIFINEFNIGFASPAADVCSMCTRLKQQMKHEKNAEKRKELLLEFTVHRRRSTTFYDLANEKPDKSITFCFDLQQVQPLPRTPVGDAFYSHQISWYAFCCVEMSSRNPNFYVWTEDLAGRGATQIGSALLHHLNSLNYDGKECIRLFCDGCGGQNKNSHIIHLLIFWLKHKSPEHVSEILITFPVRGHSFLPADRAFGKVEKILRKNPTITSKAEYVDIYSGVGKVLTLSVDWHMYDIKELEGSYRKIKGISDCKRISIKKTFVNNKVQVKVAFIASNH